MQTKSFRRDIVVLYRGSAESEKSSKKTVLLSSVQAARLRVMRAKARKEKIGLEYFRERGQDSKESSNVIDLLEFYTRTKISLLFSTFTVTDTF